ncbi:winged helix DNA-binding domain-containing protein [Longispora urticae]
MQLTDDAVRTVRLRAQLLADPVDTVAAVAARVPVQAQATPAARLAVRARSTGLTRTDVDAARADGSVVRTWAMRGTLHLLAAADVRWIVGLLGPRFARAGRGRRYQLGLDDEVAERGLTVLAAVLADGPLARDAIVERLAGHGFRLDGRSQAPAHLLALAAHRGLVCCGPEETYTLLDDWVPASPAPDDPLAELARRYLAGHGVAGPEDLAAWSGLPLGTARRAFDAIRAELRPAGPGFALAGTDLAPDREGTARLLGAFDTYLLGYRARDVDPAHARRINTGGGMIAPTALVSGSVVGTWRLERGTATVEPFGALSAGAVAELEVEAADLGRFLGEPVRLAVA